MNIAKTLAAAALVAGLAQPAAAENGRITAGVLGGLAAGAIIGSAVSGPRYYEPEPVYVAPRPVYRAPRQCYLTRGEPVWDEYRGVWRRPRVEVCD